MIYQVRLFTFGVYHFLGGCCVNGSLGRPIRTRVGGPDGEATGGEKESKIIIPERLGAFIW